jgi:hypothetical protein
MIASYFDPVLAYLVVVGVASVVALVWATRSKPPKADVSEDWLKYHQRYANSRGHDNVSFSGTFKREY